MCPRSKEISEDSKRTSIRQSSSTRSRRRAVQPDVATADEQGDFTATGIGEEERRRLVAEAAYFMAERRGFVGGSPQDDWLAAEAEIDRLMGKTRH